MRPFAVIFGILMLALDAFYVRSVGGHLQTARYTRVDGEIVASGVKKDGKDSYRPDIAYRYVARGREYVGRRVRDDGVSQSGDWAADIAAAYPVGAHVPVFYAPADPTVALLRPGLGGGDIFFGLLLLPFNGIPLAAWAAARRQDRSDRPGDETGGLLVVEQGAVTRVLPDGYRPAWNAFLGAGLAAFAATFVVVFATSFDPPLTVGLAELGAVLIVALLVYARAVVLRRRGTADLVIDAAARTLRFPQRFGGPRLTIPWTEIKAVVVERRVSRSVDLERSGSTVSYVVNVVRADDSRVWVRSCVWLDSDAADRFRDWLAARVGVA